MRRNSSVVITIIILIVLIGGGYAIFHKPRKHAPITASSTTSKAPVVKNAVIITKTDSKLGQYLADPSGKPLYTYGLDTIGVSKCTGSCLTDWPVYQDMGAVTNLPNGVGTIRRTDNSEIQYTYNGMPLYYFASDSNGQVTGDNVNNFHIARPVAAATQTTSTPSNSSSSSSPSSSPSNSTNYSAPSSGSPY